MAKNHIQEEFDIYMFLIGKIHEHMKTRVPGLACFLTFVWICLQVCAAVYAQISLFVLYASGLTGGTCAVADPPADAPEGQILKFCLCVTSLRFALGIAGEMDSASVGEKCLKRLSYKSEEMRDRYILRAVQSIIVARRFLMPTLFIMIAVMSMLPFSGDKRAPAKILVSGLSVMFVFSLDNAVCNFFVGPDRKAEIVATLNELLNEDYTYALPDLEYSGLNVENRSAAIIYGLFFVHGVWRADIYQRIYVEHFGNDNCSEIVGGVLILGTCCVSSFLVLRLVAVWRHVSSRSPAILIAKCLTIFAGFAGGIWMTLVAAKLLAPGWEAMTSQELVSKISSACFVAAIVAETLGVAVSRKCHLDAHRSSDEKKDN